MWLSKVIGDAQRRLSISALKDYSRALNIPLVLEQDCQCRIQRCGVDRFGVQEDECACPIQGFAHTGALAQVQLAELVNDLDRLSRQLIPQVRHMHTNDLQLGLQVREVNKQV